MVNSCQSMNKTYSTSFDFLQAEAMCLLRGTNGPHAMA